MKRGRNLKLLRDFFALSGGQLLSKLIGFVAFAYLARTLDPESYGIVEYAVGLSVFFAMIIDFGLGPIGVREISRAPQRVASLAAHIPAARLLIALVAIPIMGLTTVLTGQANETVQLVWLFSLGLLAIPWKQDWLLQGLEMMRAAAAAQVIRMSAFTIGIIVCVHASQDLLRVGMVEIAAAAIGAAYYLTVQQFWVTPVRLGFSGGELRRLMEQGLSVGLSNMVGAIIQYAPLFLVASIVGGAETAWFGASHRIVISLVTFSWVYHFNLYPAIARRVGKAPEDLDGLVRASFRVVAWAGIGLALVLTLLARPLLVLAFGDQFATAAPAFSVLIWVVPITFLSGHARYVLIAVGQQRFLLAAQISGAVAMLLVSLVLIPVLHSVGAAVAMLVASLVVWAAAHTFAVVHIGRLPALSIVALPAIIAMLSGLLVHFIDTNPWVATAVTALVYALCAPMVDGKLLSALRRLGQAKADLAPPSEATP